MDPYVFFIANLYVPLYIITWKINYAKGKNVTKAGKFVT